MRQAVVEKGNYQNISTAKSGTDRRVVSVGANGRYLKVINVNFYRNLMAPYISSKYNLPVLYKLTMWTFVFLLDKC